ncbi:hypothetical protein C8F01DRAFT_1229068, partial [Mycena amicta]
MSSDHVLAPIHPLSTVEAPSMDSNRPSSPVTEPGEHNIHQTVPRSERPVQTATLHHRMAGDGDTYDVGTFFHAAQNVNISGGSFLSHVEQTLPSGPPSDFRTIPLGDIDLQEELGSEDSSAYRGSLHRRRHEQSVVRIMYSAKVEGRDMTAVLYEGDEQAKKDWVNEVKQMSSVRHPNLLQLYGIASSGRTHAAIYHGDLVSMEYLLDHHRANAKMLVNIRLHLSVEFWRFACSSTSIHSSMGGFMSWSMSYFFHASTGRLCIAVNPNGQTTFFPPAVALLTGQARYSNTTNLNSLVESTPIDELHRFFSSRAWFPHHRLGPLQPTLFAVTSSGSYAALAMLTSDHFPVELMGYTSWLMVGSTRLRNGWQRYSIGPEKAGQRVHFSPGPSPNLLNIMDALWFSQAGHIFNLLNIRDKFDSYFLAYGRARLAFTVPDNVPHGYLFCRPTGPRRWLPKKPFQVFWSLDPQGREQLSWKEARKQGFPRLIISNDFSTYQRQWDASVYEEIRAMHIAKGFNPDSQDLARHLGYLLFELVSDIKARNRTARFLDEDWEDDGWTLADLFSVPETPAVFFDDGWEDDGWTLADLFVSETQPSSPDERAHLNASSTLKNILHGSALPRAELIVIFLVALARKSSRRLRGDPVFVLLGDDELPVRCPIDRTIVVAPNELGDAGSVSETEVDISQLQAPVLVKFPRLTCAKNEVRRPRETLPGNAASEGNAGFGLFDTSAVGDNAANAVGVIMKVREERVTASDESQRIRHSSSRHALRCQRHTRPLRSDKAGIGRSGDFGVGEAHGVCKRVMEYFALRESSVAELFQRRDKTLEAKLTQATWRIFERGPPSLDLLLSQAFSLPTLPFPPIPLAFEWPFESLVWLSLACAQSVSGMCLRPAHALADVDVDAARVPLVLQARTMQVFLEHCSISRMPCGSSSLGLRRVVLTLWHDSTFPSSCDPAGNASLDIMNGSGEPAEAGSEDGDPELSTASIFVQAAQLRGLLGDDHNIRGWWPWADEGAFAVVSTLNCVKGFVCAGLSPDDSVAPCIRGCYTA